MNFALLYVRVSSKEQEREGYSLDAQEKLGDEYALRNNLTIKKRWKVSESAWRDERDAFNEMLEYAKKHEQVKHIIFDVTDRMTRNDMDKIKIWTLVKFHDKTIHFSRSNKKIDKNSGSEDEFMLDIEVAVAKKMSNDISRKSKMGMQEKAEQGFYPSRAPFGYYNNPVTRLLDVNKENSPYVQRAFSLMASGSYSLEMLANVLYEEGLRTAQNIRMNKGTLWHILKNSIYYGVFTWNGSMHQGNHTPLISKEVFDKAQSVLDGKAHNHISKKNFSFNNLITCGICDCKILGERKKNRYTYYHCTFSKGRHNGIGYIPEDRLASMFEEPIRKITLSNNVVDWLKEGLRERSRSTVESQEIRLNALRTQEERINTRLSKLFDLKIDGDMDNDVFKAKEQEYKGQLFEVRAQRESVKAINQNFYEDGCKTLELANRLNSLYLKANYEDKAKILKFVASNYTLNDITLYPVYRKPFNFIVEKGGHLNSYPHRDSNPGPETENLIS